MLKLMSSPPVHTLKSLVEIVCELLLLLLNKESWPASIRNPRAFIPQVAGP
jgi:hypothetical protein